MEEKLDIMIFGQLEDITGSSLISIDRVNDTEALQASLCINYPLLIRKKFLIAVDKKIINENTKIGESSVIALLPPFSGG